MKLSLIHFVIHLLLQCSDEGQVSLEKAVVEIMQSAAKEISEEDTVENEEPEDEQFEGGK